MHLQEQRYEDLVRRLSAYGYDVQVDPLGYIVRHRVNTADRSRARHLGDLADLTELIEWATRRAEQCIASSQLAESISTLSQCHVIAGSAQIYQIEGIVSNL